MQEGRQYGFTPQKGTTKAAMEIKEYVMEGLAGGKVTAFISLDVQGAFDAAFWPRILNELRACSCPKHLHNLTRSNFSNRSAVLSVNSTHIEKKVSRGVHKAPVADQGSGTYSITHC
jgi:hypothetical protein